jgi:predicted transcriptional regulator
MLNLLNSDLKKNYNAFKKNNVLVLQNNRRIEIINKRSYQFFRLSKRLRTTSILFIFNNCFYLYLLRSNLYKFLNRSIKDTNIRKLIKLEILKATEFQEYCVDFKLIIPIVISIMETKIISKSIGLEHPNVKRVIEIAEDIMSKNKILNLETLYNVAKKSLKLPRNGLLFIIQFLINKKVLIEGSKFSRETVLSNPTRRGIYNYIRANPGVHFSILRKKALSDESGSSGQLVWHLEMLLKFNYINKIKAGNYTVFLPIDMEVELGIINFLLRDEINRKIVGLLSNHSSIKNSEIFKFLDEKREKVNYRLKNLINYDLICLKEDPSKEVYLNPDKQEDVINILNQIKINLYRINLN